MRSRCQLTPHQLTPHQLTPHQLTSHCALCGLDFMRLPIAMEVDPDPSSASVVIEASSVASTVLAPSSTQGSVTVSLHPLVMLNISEHWTRTRAQNGGDARRVLGALIGEQRGRHVEVKNSFELDWSLVDGSVVIDNEYYRTKESQFKQVFPDMELIGWYATSDPSKKGPTEQDVRVHRQITELHESPLFLLMDTASHSSSSKGHVNSDSELPVNVYESLIDLSDGPRLLFVRLNFSLVTEEAERIGLDHVAKHVTNESSGPDSKVSEVLSVQQSALKMLAARVAVILAYVKAVENNELEWNEALMREAKSVADKLPVLQADRFEPEFYTQSNDAAIVTYLATIMKSCTQLNTFVNRFNVLHQRQGGSRRLRGMFF